MAVPPRIRKKPKPIVQGPTYWACLRCGIEGTGRMPAGHEHQKQAGKVVVADLKTGELSVDKS